MTLETHLPCWLQKNNFFQTLIKGIYQNSDLLFKELNKYYIAYSVYSFLWSDYREIWLHNNLQLKASLHYLNW